MISLGEPAVRRSGIMTLLYRSNKEPDEVFPNKALSIKLNLRFSTAAHINSPIPHLLIPGFLLLSLFLLIIS